MGARAASSKWIVTVAWVSVFLLSVVFMSQHISTKKAQIQDLRRLRGPEPECGLGPPRICRCAARNDLPPALTYCAGELGNTCFLQARNLFRYDGSFDVSLRGL